MGQKLRFKVEGMMCEGCISTLRKTLFREADVSDIAISLERRELELTV
ncbi:MAG: heavy metal-associated domain-containing protein [Acetobacteraceae bacterium]